MLTFGSHSGTFSTINGFFNANYNANNVTLVATGGSGGGATLGANLILNPGAEEGAGSASGNDVLAVPRWTTVGNATVVQYGAPGFPTGSDLGSPQRGNN
ncbi:MAG: hypothetical protein ABI939_09055, partial [Anaerolineaceae bacterium]